MKTRLRAFLSGFIAIVMVAAASATQAADTVAKMYDIKDVSELVVSNGARVQITQGDTESLRVEAEADVMERVSVDLTGNKLTLGIKRPQRKFWFFQNLHFDPDMVTYVLQLKNLNHMDLSGAVHADLANWSGKSFSINASGASEVFFKTLSLETLLTDLSGASQFHSQQLTATNLKFGLSGAANVDIGSKGKATLLQLDLSGASNFHGKLLEVAKAEIELSGASSCEVFAIESLKAEASGASHIRYIGNPQTSFKSSGVSDIKSI